MAVSAAETVAWLMIGVVAAALEMTHGAAWSAHELFAWVIAPLQHAAPPPGKSLQPGPPHFPHSLAQQLVCSRIPFWQPGSELGLGEGPAPMPLTDTLSQVELFATSSENMCRP
jgi:hypothetical protein